MSKFKQMISRYLLIEMQAGFDSVRKNVSDAILDDLQQVLIFHLRNQLDHICKHKLMRIFLVLKVNQVLVLAQLLLKANQTIFVVQNEVL